MHSSHTRQWSWIWLPIAHVCMCVGDYKKSPCCCLVTCVSSMLSTCGLTLNGYHGVCSSELIAYECSNTTYNQKMNIVSSCGVCSALLSPDGMMSVRVLHEILVFTWSAIDSVSGWLYVLLRRCMVDSQFYNSIQLSKRVWLHTQHMGIENNAAAVCRLCSVGP